MIKKIAAVVLLCGLHGGLLLGMKAAHVGCHVSVKNSDVGGATVMDDGRIDDIDSISRLCSDLMLQIIEQPEFVDNSNALRPERYKELPLTCLIIGQICSILNHNLEHPLEACVYDSSAEDADGGANTLIFWLPKSWELPVDYDHLVVDYQKIIEELKVGWRSVPSTHTGSMFDRRLIFGEWFAFVKEKKLEYEAALLTNFAEKFGLKDSVRFSDVDMWGCEPEGTVYLWIQPDAFDKFNRIFKFFYQLP